jgi:hypothetical protein
LYYHGYTGPEEVVMALKPITLRLDEEEYEKLKDHLSKFGDPDINVAYVVRAYIRDLNRTLPFVVQAGWDLKTYFGFLGVWLKQFISVGGPGEAGKGLTEWWRYWSTLAASPLAPAKDTGEKGMEEDKGPGHEEPEKEE